MLLNTAKISEIAPLIIIIVLLLALMIFAIYMAIKTSKAKKQAKQTTKKAKTDRSATLAGAYPHFNGLPVPENTLCQVFSTPTAIQILANGQQFNLNKNKIIDIALTSNTEIQKQYVSSVGGAVGGAILFGPIGAMIGGRTKTKEIRDVHNYLIFTYLEDADASTSKYIGFDVTNSYFSAVKFVKEFKEGNRTVPPNIEL